MLDDFMVRAGLAAVGLALAAGPLGCFVVWRRMAYFGDATAHAAILGVALSFSFNISIIAGVLVMAMLMAFAVSALAGRTFQMDTLLGVSAHGALAVGLVAFALTARSGLGLESFLFGEILAVSRTDLGIIWGGAFAVLALVAWRWSALLTATLDSDLAAASGIDPRREQLILTLALAVLVAVAIKVVGALLITAMLIIPAAAARPFARSPEMMAGLAALIGAASGLLGLAASYRLDTPTGPTIVTAALAIFAVSGIVLISRGRAQR
ncbi:zinc transport system permease protein [Amorphus orientalis]|uniref:High-affinity zinc uptake system membrane protein ZnuB n=2 Tax=Amorphus orientalis TaxID=649198 RepID=A0AAE4AW24_9HYPH|nr:metal ABC transporter permease [Amorphus orientalis]MDQ0317309.1 zinc transport system permease protein [Amorphus orientalis]